MIQKGMTLFSPQDTQLPVYEMPTQVSFDETALTEFLSQDDSCGQKLIDSVKAGQHPVISMADGSALQFSDALQAFSILHAFRS
jgi:hypothetical protein